MRKISSLRDLEFCGIIPLTGEADATSTRTLCDVTREGLQIIAESFGLSVTKGEFGDGKPFGAWHLTLPENWNNSQKQVASIMLPNWCPELYKVIGMFALARAGYSHIVLARNSVVGLKDNIEAHLEHYRQYGVDGPGDFIRVIENWYGTSNDHQRGDRNVHSMSGRSV